MISFIIIGRNEGWKLTKCFQGVLNTIKTNDLENYEIIYVDSNSTDDSIERAKQFSEIKIYQLTTVYNAAIARNLGASKAKGHILFFIDGDMEILTEFLPLVYSVEDGLKYPFVSGQLRNYNYNEHFEFLNMTWHYKHVMKEDKYLPTTGGIFLVNMILWEKIEGMDIRYKRGEDLDLGLRLARKGYKILRKKEIIANHYTVSYTHHSRLWKTIFSGDFAFSNSFLLKKHILNKYVHKKIMKQFYTLYSLIFVVSFFFTTKFFPILLLYPFVVLIKTIRSKTTKFFFRVEIYFFYIVRDIAFIFYLFVPLRKINASEIKFDEIK